jgi:hypothetical protein
MAVIRSLIGSDTIKLGDRLLADFGHGEVAKITYPTELATVKTGKNGNTIYVQNASGFQAVLELKIIRGSADDKALQSLLTLYRSEPTLFVLQNAELTKKLGDGTGKAQSDTIILTGGIPTKQVEMVSNVEGDVEQGLSVYTWVFATSDRALA